MDFSLGELGFYGTNLGKTVFDFIIEIYRLPFRWFYFVINVHMGRTVQYETVQEPIKTGHETDQNDKCPDTESNAQCGNGRLLYPGKQMRPGYAQYDPPIDHGPGL